MSPIQIDFGEPASTSVATASASCRDVLGLTPINEICERKWRTILHQLGWWSEGPFSERMRADNSRICVNYGYLMDHPVRLQQRSFECEEEFSGVK